MMSPRMDSLDPETISPPLYNSEHVEPVVVQIKNEIRSLLTERSAVDKRIDTVKKALVGMATLTGDEVLDVLKEGLPPAAASLRGHKNGITQACRTVLMNSKKPLSAKDVCTQVRLQNPSLLANYATPMVPLYAVLGRLVNRREAQVLIDESGHRAWQWIEPSPEQVAEPLEVHDQL